VEADTKVVENFVVKTEREFVAPACRSADCMGRIRSTGSKQSKTNPQQKYETGPLLQLAVEGDRNLCNVVAEALITSAI